MDSPMLLNAPGALRTFLLREEAAAHRLAREEYLRKMVEEHGEA